MTIAALQALLDEEQGQQGQQRPVPRARTSTDRTHHQDKEHETVDAFTAVIHSMHNDGAQPQQIAEKLGVPVAEVTEITASYGQTNVDQAQPVTSFVAAPEVAELLVLATDHPDPQVRKDGEQAGAALAALHTRRRVDMELAEIATQKTELEKRLADLQAREAELRPATAKKRSRSGTTTPRWCGPGPGTTASTARPWAGCRSTSWTPGGQRPTEPRSHVRPDADQPGPARLHAAALAGGGTASYTGPALLVLAVAAAICGVLLTVIATIKVAVAVWTSGTVPAAVRVAISLTEHCLRKRD